MADKGHHVESEKGKPTKNESAEHNQKCLHGLAVSELGLRTWHRDAALQLFNLKRSHSVNKSY